SSPGNGKPAQRYTLEDYRKAAWLGIRQASTVLPSVASLKSLRQFAKDGHASKPFLGVGNPLLEGPQDDPDWGDQYRRLALAARNQQDCLKAPTARPGSHASRSPAPIGQVFDGSHADIEQIRRLIPLPETADELCEVARALAVPDSGILLGER